MTEPLTLPSDSASWLGFIEQRADAALAAAREAVARLKDGTARTPEEVVALWNEGDTATANAASFTSLFAEVHPDAAVREVAEDRVQQVTGLVTERDQDRALFEVLSAVDTSGLDAEAQRLIEKALRDFRRGGVDRDEATRARLTEISTRITAIEQEFSRNIRDDVRTTQLRPEQLEGLPADYIAERPAGDDGLVTITSDYPDTIPFLSYAADRTAREQVARAFNSRGWPANDALLTELFALRHEQATLLGYTSWADFDAELKMIGTASAIEEFIGKITALAEDAALEERALLVERAQQDDPALTALLQSDNNYYTELVRRERFDVDAQKVREYFDFARVRQGVLDVTGKLFGVEYHERTDVPLWADDVTCYDVVRGGERIGRIYLDLHPRDGKFNHAAQFDLVTGVTGVQLPEGVLVCNFARGLMEHGEVTTMFHEFGHLVHHILGGHQRFARFSGVATEWDFVEAPSQMLEEWAWDADILATFAQNAAGETIPADLVTRMREAEDFGRALGVRRQMVFAGISYHLHMDRPADLDAAVADITARYGMLDPVPDTHMQSSFGHLTGYSSAYYTYMWSLVIAKDMFSAFDANDLFAADVAGRYRDEILARGGSADAATLVANFLGRDYSFDAYGRWLSGSPTPA